MKIFELALKAQRLTREEAEKRIEEVKQVLHTMGVDPKNVVPGGSYRRGKPSVGDLDLAIFQPDIINKEFYQKFQETMRGRGHEVTPRTTGESQTSMLVDDFLIELKKGSVENKGAFLVFMTGCLRGDTRVALLDGRNVTIRQLTDEFNLGKENWVYSVDKDGRVVPNRILCVGRTVLDAVMVRVTLDNNKSVVATLDHRFIMRGRS